MNFRSERSVERTVFADRSQGRSVEHDRAASPFRDMRQFSEGTLEKAMEKIDKYPQKGKNSQERKLQ
jgi:hypothetical protein